MRVDPSNEDQLGYWDGASGAYWARRAERFDDGVARYQGPFLDAAGIESDAAVLDVGCGTGQTARDAAGRAASVLGVDLSGPMIELARRRSAGVPNVTFEQADAQVHPFAPVDFVISRSGAMFFGDPAAAFANLARALRPGGRLALMAWQPLARNEWTSTFRTIFAAGRDLPAPRADRPGPLSLSEPDRTRALLTAAGFTDVHIEGHAQPMYFGADVDDAYEFVSGLHAPMLTDVDPARHPAVLDALRADLAAHQTPDGVYYASAAWFITAKSEADGAVDSFSQ